MPRVTIVLHEASAADDLVPTWASVRAQTLVDWECIIVRGQETRPIWLDAAPDRRARVVTSAHPGRGAAWNAGMAQARSTYVLPLDACFRLAPTMLEKAVHVLDHAAGIAIVYADVQVNGARPQQIRSGPLDLERAMKATMIPSASLYRRSLWEATGGYDEALSTSADRNFWIAAMRRGVRAHGLAEPLLCQDAPTPVLAPDPNDLARVILNHPGLFSLAEETVARTVLGPTAHRAPPAPRSPALSAVVVAAGDDPRLFDTVASLLAQELGDFEIIFITNGGPSAESRIYGWDTPGRIHYVHLPCARPEADARAFGRRIARGRTVADFAPGRHPPTEFAHASAHIP